MNDRARTKMAAAVTVTFLGAMSVAGVIAHGSKPPAPAAAVSKAAPGQSHKASQLRAAPVWHEQDQHD